MSSTIIAILLLITFIGFIVYILKGGNLMIGFFHHGYFMGRDWISAIQCCH